MAGVVRASNGTSHLSQPPGKILNMNRLYYISTTKKIYNKSRTIKYKYIKNNNTK